MADRRHATTADEDTPLTSATGVLANDTDVDGDPLTLRIVDRPGARHADAQRATARSPTRRPPNYNGTDSFTYKANDGTVDSQLGDGHDHRDTRSTTRPVADDDSYTTDEDTPLTVAAPGVLANDTDVDGDTLTATLVAGPATAR